MSDLPVFPDGSQLSIEDRLALLEARTGLVTPLALVPPITIGELVDVPAPGSQIAAQWAQEVSARVIHRFANFAALNAWAAPSGSFAVTLDTGVLWRRFGAAWGQQTPWQGTGTPAAVSAPGAGGPTNAIVNTLVIPADPGLRVATVHQSMTFQRYAGNPQQIVQLLVNGTNYGQTIFPQSAQDPTGIGGTWPYHVAKTANIPLGANAAVTVQSVIVSTASAIWNIEASPIYNRLDAVVTPRGY